MSMMPAASLVALAPEQTRILLLPAWVFGALAFAGFLLLLVVLWFFRNTATKYDTPVMVVHDDAGDPRGSRRSVDPGVHH
jgi:hypothetical protein